eukprot:4425793-Pleurochrysis_carterae.AAC.2
MRTLHPLENRTVCRNGRSRVEECWDFCRTFRNKKAVVAYRRPRLQVEATINRDCQAEILAESDNKNKVLASHERSATREGWVGQKDLLLCGCGLRMVLSLSFLACVTKPCVRAEATGVAYNTRAHYSLESCLGWGARGSAGWPLPAPRSRAA